MKKEKIMEMNRTLKLNLFMKLGFIMVAVFFFMNFQWWIALLFTFMLAVAVVIYRLLFTYTGKYAIDQIRYTVEYEKTRSQLKKKI